jgi:pimeloyl-ACP methyl ester carboxylesterase
MSADPLLLLPGLPCDAALRSHQLRHLSREDVATSLAHAEEIAALTPGARFAVIEDCGQLSPLDRPQAVTALLRLWLAGAVP